MQHRLHLRCIKVNVASADTFESKAHFVARIEQAFAGEPIEIADAISVVFRFLTAKIGAGEIEDVRHALPADLRTLWPAPANPS